MAQNAPWLAFTKILLTNLIATSSFVRMFVPKNSHRWVKNYSNACKGGLTVVDISEGAAAELAGQSVFSSDSQFHFMLKFVLNFSQCSV